MSGLGHTQACDCGEVAAGPESCGRNHVHADMANLGGFAPMRCQIVGKSQQRPMILVLGGKQRAVGLEVIHDDDVVLSALGIGLSHTDEFDLEKGLAGSCLTDVVIDAPPKLLVRAAKQSRVLACRQLLAQCKRQRVDWCGEARSRAYPRRRHLRGLVATTAGEAEHIAMQPSLELEEVDVTPEARESMVRPLNGGSASGTSEAGSRAADLYVNPASGGIKLDAPYHPLWRQPPRTGKQGLNRYTHLGSPTVRRSPVGIWTAAHAPTQTSNGQRIQHA
jgi:hypothetical protein